jgi:hypothetical protein
MYFNSIRPILVGFIMFAATASQVLAQNPDAYIWTSPSELAAIKMEGDAWGRLKSAAKGSAGTPNLSDQNQNNNVLVLAKALVYARCSLEPSHNQCADINLSQLHNEVVSQIMDAIGTEDGGRTLALARELAAYVIAADLVGMPADKDATFRSWLDNVRHEQLDGKTLVSTHEKRANNWGTHAGASRAAAAIYLGDTADLDRIAKVLKGWLGDRSAYAGFDYGDLSWQCDSSKPVGINPRGCTKDGHPIDGVLPDDQRRNGGFSWPPPKANYVYGALSGIIVTAVLLDRHGYDVLDWEDKAILRAYRWLQEQANFSPDGDDTWQMPLVDYYYGTNYWGGGKTSPGKNMGWTDWTHSSNNRGAIPGVNIAPAKPTNLTVD